MRPCLVSCEMHASSHTFWDPLPYVVVDVLHTLRIVVGSQLLTGCAVPYALHAVHGLSCRDYSARDEARCDCDKLQQVLESLPGAQRMVVSIS